MATAGSIPPASPEIPPQGGLFSMSNAYQGADLSVRRARTIDTNGGLFPVSANSLEDLANPANRFAHTMLRFSSGAGTTTTMPILALTPSIPIQEYALAKGNPVFGPGTSAVSLNVRVPGVFADYAIDSYSESGFIPGTFLRRNRILGRDPANPSGPLQFGDAGLAFSESLATNCVAFDLKGFDPNARMLYHAGPDGIVGAGVNPSVFGLSGTDDLVLSPSDPGYDESIRYLVAVDGSNAALPPPTWLPTANQTLANLTASTGCFVDVGWGMKSIFARNPAVGILTTPLSGRDATGITSATLRRSGRALNVGGINYNIYQPCFDSFTDVFENDGFNQFNATTGTTFIDGRDYLQGIGPPTPIPGGADLGVNGLDDALVDVTTPANGMIDDFDERDTSPPINFAMPAIQATIRLEDKQAGVIQQIAVTQSLVNP